MKTSVKYLLSLFLLAYLSGSAQAGKGADNASPDKTSTKGKRELRKDKGVKRHTEKSLKSNEEKQEKQANKPFIKKSSPKAPNGKKARKEKNGELTKKE